MSADLSVEGLADDSDEFTEKFGSLSFTDDGTKGMPRDPSGHNLSLAGNVDIMGKPGPSGVSFEVVNARIEKEGRNKYVLYSVLMTRSTQMDNAPAVVERRYSDFDILNSNLRKKYPAIMDTISFPNKKVTGNFKAATIAQRSRAFEQYLAHLFSLELLRQSSDFANFFYGLDIHKGFTCIRNAQYQEAIRHLEFALVLQKKLLGDSHADVISSLCGIIASYNALEKDKQAQACSEVALRCIGSDDHNKHLVPLLLLNIRLCWKLGKDKKDLESRLQTIKLRGVRVDNAPTLLEIVVTCN